MEERSNRNGGRVPLKEFLHERCEHHFNCKNYCVCDICHLDLIKWTDKEALEFVIKFRDDRRKTHVDGGYSERLFELYEENVASEWRDGKKGSSKDNMKKALNNLVKSGDLVKINTEEPHLKRYRFSKNPLHQQASNASAAVGSFSQYQTVAESFEDVDFPNAFPDLAQIAETMNEGLVPMLAEEELMDLDQEAVDLNQNTFDDLPDFMATEDYAWLLKSCFDRLTAAKVRDKALSLRFHVFARLLRSEQTSVMNKYVDGRSFSGGFRVYPEFDSTGCPMDASNQGRFGSSEFEERRLEDVHIDFFDQARDCENDNVHKCIETFDSGALVFVWRRFLPPSWLDTSSVPKDIQHLICSRLYLTRLCKGYKDRSSTTDATPPNSNLPSLAPKGKVWKLPMCLKCPHASEATLDVFQEHMVFDLFDCLIKCLKLSQTFDLNQLKKQYAVYIGLKSQRTADSSNLHMRFEVTSELLETIFAKFNPSVSDSGSETTRLTDY